MSSCAFSSDVVDPLVLGYIHTNFIPSDIAQPIAATAERIQTTASPALDEDSPLSTASSPSKQIDSRLLYDLFYTPKKIAEMYNQVANQPTPSNGGLGGDALEESLGASNNKPSNKFMFGGNLISKMLSGSFPMTMPKSFCSFVDRRSHFIIELPFLDEDVLIRRHRKRELRRSVRRRRRVAVGHYPSALNQTSISNEGSDESSSDASVCAEDYISSPSTSSHSSTSTVIDDIENPTTNREEAEPIELSSNIEEAAAVWQTLCHDVQYLNDASAAVGGVGLEVAVGLVRVLLIRLGSIDTILTNQRLQQQSDSNANDALRERSKRKGSTSATPTPVAVSVQLKELFSTDSLRIPTSSCNPFTVFLATAFRSFLILTDADVGRQEGASGGGKKSSDAKLLPSIKAISKWLQYLYERRGWEHYYGSSSVNPNNPGQFFFNGYDGWGRQGAEEVVTTLKPSSPVHPDKQMDNEGLVSISRSEEKQLNQEERRLRRLAKHAKAANEAAPLTVESHPYRTLARLLGANITEISIATTILKHNLLEKTLRDRGPYCGEGVLKLVHHSRNLHDSMLVERASTIELTPQSRPRLASTSMSTVAPLILSSYEDTSGSGSGGGAGILSSGSTSRASTFIRSTGDAHGWESTSHNDDDNDVERGSGDDSGSHSSSSSIPNDDVGFINDAVSISSSEAVSGPSSRIHNISFTSGASAYSKWSGNLSLSRRPIAVVSSYGGDEDTLSESDVGGFDGEVNFDQATILHILPASNPYHLHTTTAAAAAAAASSDIAVDAQATNNPNKSNRGSTTSAPTAASAPPIAVMAFPPPLDHPARIHATYAIQDIVLRGLIPSATLTRLLPPHPSHYRTVAGTYGPTALCGVRLPSSHTSTTSNSISEMYCHSYVFVAFVYLGRQTVARVKAIIKGEGLMSRPIHNVAVRAALSGRWRRAYTSLVKSGVPEDPRCLWSALCSTIGDEMQLTESAVTAAASAVDDSFIEGSGDGGATVPALLRLEEKRKCFGGSGAADFFVRQTTARSERYGNLCGRFGMMPTSRIIDSDLPEVMTAGEQTDNRSLRGVVNTFLETGNTSAHSLLKNRKSASTAPTSPISSTPSKPTTFLNAYPSSGISEDTQSSLVSKQLNHAADVLKKRCMRIAHDSISYCNRVGTCYVVPLVMLPRFKTLVEGMDVVDEDATTGTSSLGVPAHNFVLPKSLFQRTDDIASGGARSKRSVQIESEVSVPAESISKFSLIAAEGLFDSWRSSALGTAHSTSAYTDPTAPIYQPIYVRSPLPPPPLARQDLGAHAGSVPQGASPSARMPDSAIGVPFEPATTALSFAKNGRELTQVNQNQQVQSHRKYAVGTFADVERHQTAAYPRFSDSLGRKQSPAYDVAIRDPFCVSSGPMGGQQQRMSARMTLLCLTAYCRLPKLTPLADLPNDAAYFFEIISADEQAHLQERLFFHPLLFRRKRLFDASSNFLPNVMTNGSVSSGGLQHLEAVSYVHAAHHQRGNPRLPRSHSNSATHMTSSSPVGNGGGVSDTTRKPKRGSSTSSQHHLVDRATAEKEDPFTQYFKQSLVDSWLEGTTEGGPNYFASTSLPTLLSQGGNASQTGSISTGGVGGFAGGSGGSQTTFAMGSSHNAFTISGSSTNAGVSTFFSKDLLPSGAGEGSCIEYVSRDDLISAVDYELRRRGHPDVPSFYYDDEVFHSSESTSVEDEDHPEVLLECEEEDYEGFFDPNHPANVAIHGYDEYALAKLRLSSLDVLPQKTVPIRQSTRGRSRDASNGLAEDKTGRAVRHRYFRHGIQTDANQRPPSTTTCPPPLQDTLLVTSLLNPYRHRDVFAATLSQQTRRSNPVILNSAPDVSLGTTGEGTSAVSHYALAPPVLGSLPSPLVPGTDTIEVPVVAEQASSLFFTTEAEWLREASLATRRSTYSPQALWSWPGSLRPLSKPLVVGSRGGGVYPKSFEGPHSQVSLSKAPVNGSSSSSSKVPEGQLKVSAYSKANNSSHNQFRILPIWTVLEDPSISLSATNRRLPLFPLTNEPAVATTSFVQPLFLGDAMSSRTSLLHGHPSNCNSIFDHSSSIAAYSPLGSLFFSGYSSSLTSGVYQLPSALVWAVMGAGEGGPDASTPSTGGAETISSFATTTASSYVFYTPPTPLGVPQDRAGPDEGLYNSSANLSRLATKNVVFPYNPVAVRFAPPSHMTAAGVFSSATPDFANTLAHSHHSLLRWKQAIGAGLGAEEDGAPKPLKSQWRKTGGQTLRQTAAGGASPLRSGMSEILPTTATEPSAVGSRILASFKSNFWRFQTQSQTQMLHQLLMLTAVDNVKIQYITSCSPPGGGSAAPDSLLLGVSYFLPHAGSFNDNQSAASRLNAERLPFFPSYKGSVRGEQRTASSSEVSVMNTSPTTSPWFRPFRPSDHSFVFQVSVSTLLPKESKKDREILKKAHDILAHLYVRQKGMYGAIWEPDEAAVAATARKVPHSPHTSSALAPSNFAASAHNVFHWLVQDQIHQQQHHQLSTGGLLLPVQPPVRGPPGGDKEHLAVSTASSVHPRSNFKSVLKKEQRCAQRKNQAFVVGEDSASSAEEDLTDESQSDVLTWSHVQGRTAAERREIRHRLRNNEIRAMLEEAPAGALGGSGGGSNLLAHYTAVSPLVSSESPTSTHTPTTETDSTEVGVALGVVLRALVSREHATNAHATSRRSMSKCSKRATLLSPNDASLVGQHVEQDEEDSLPPPSDSPPSSPELSPLPSDDEDATPPTSPTEAVPPPPRQSKEAATTLTAVEEEYDITGEPSISPLDEDDGGGAFENIMAASPPPSPLDAPWRTLSQKGILLSPERRKQRRAAFADDTPDALLPPGLQDEEDDGSVSSETPRHRRAQSPNRGVRFADPLTAVTMIAAIGRGLSTSGRKKQKKVKREAGDAVDAPGSGSNASQYVIAERARLAAQRLDLLKSKSSLSSSKPWWYRSKMRRRAQLEADPRFCKVPYYISEVMPRERHPTTDNENDTTSSPSSSSTRILSPQQHSPPPKKLRVYYRFFSALAVDIVDAYLAECSETTIIDDREGHDVFTTYPILEAYDATTRSDRAQHLPPSQHHQDTVIINSTTAGASSTSTLFLQQDDLPNVCARFPGKFTLPESHNYFGYFSQKMACVRDGDGLAPNPSSTTTSLVEPRLQPSKSSVHTSFVLPLFADSSKEVPQPTMVPNPTGAITKPHLQMSLSTLERTRYVAMERARRAVDRSTLIHVVKSSGLSVPTPTLNEMASIALGPDNCLERALRDELDVFGKSFGKMQRKHRVIRSMSKLYKVAAETDSFSMVHLQRLEGTITQIMSLHTQLSHLTERLRRMKKVAIESVRQVAELQQTVAQIVSQDVLLGMGQEGDEAFSPASLLKTLEICCDAAEASHDDGLPHASTATTSSPPPPAGEKEHFWNKQNTAANITKVLELTEVIRGFVSERCNATRYAPTGPTSSPMARYMALVSRLVLLVIIEWSIIHAENEERLVVDKFILALFQAQQQKRATTQGKTQMDPGPAPSMDHTTTGDHMAAVLTVLESIRTRSNDLIVKGENESPIRILHRASTLDGIASKVLEGGWLSKFEVLDNEKAAGGMAMAVLPPSKNSAETTPSRMDPFTESLAVATNRHMSASYPTAAALWQSLRRDVGATGVFSSSFLSNGSSSTDGEGDHDDIASSAPLGVGYIPLLRNYSPTWLYPINQPKLHHLRDQLYLRRLDREKRQWILTQEKFAGMNEDSDGGASTRREEPPVETPKPANSSSPQQLPTLPDFFVSEQWNSEFFAALLLHHYRSFKTVVERVILSEVVVGLSDSEAQLHSEGDPTCMDDTPMDSDPSSSAASLVHLCRLGLIDPSALDGNANHKTGGNSNPSKSGDAVPIPGFLRYVLESSCDQFEKRIEKLEVTLACRVFRLHKLKAHRDSIITVGKAGGLVSIPIVKGIISKLRSSLVQLDRPTLETDLKLAVGDVMRARRDAQTTSGSKKSSGNQHQNPLPKLDSTVAHLREQQRLGYRSLQALYLSLPDAIRTVPQAVPPPILSTSYCTTATSLFPQDSFCSVIYGPPTSPFRGDVLPKSRRDSKGSKVRQNQPVDEGSQSVAETNHTYTPTSDTVAINPSTHHTLFSPMDSSTTPDVCEAVLFPTSASIAKDAFEKCKGGQMSVGATANAHTSLRLKQLSMWWWYFSLLDYQRAESYWRSQPFSKDDSIKTIRQKCLPRSPFVGTQAFAIIDSYYRRILDPHGVILLPPNPVEGAVLDLGVHKRHIQAATSSTLTWGSSGMNNITTADSQKPLDPVAAKRLASKFSQHPLSSYFSSRLAAGEGEVGGHELNQSDPLWVLRSFATPPYIPNSASHDATPHSNPSRCAPVNQATPTYVYAQFMHPVLVLAMVSQFMGPQPVRQTTMSAASHPAVLAAVDLADYLVKGTRAQATYRPVRAREAVSSTSPYALSEEKSKQTYRHPVEFFAESNSRQSSSTSSASHVEEDTMSQSEFWKLPLFTSPWTLSAISRSESAHSPSQGGADDWMRKLILRRHHEHRAHHEEGVEEGGVSGDVEESHIKSLLGKYPPIIYSQHNPRDHTPMIPSGLEHDAGPVPYAQELLGSLSVTYTLKKAFFKADRQQLLKAGGDVDGLPIVPCTFGPVTDSYRQGAAPSSSPAREGASGTGNAMFDDTFMVDDLRVEVSRLCATLLEVRKRMAARQAQRDCLTTALKVLRVCESLQFDQGTKFYSLFIAATFIHSFQLPQTSLTNNNGTPFPNTNSYSVGAAGRHRAAASSADSSPLPIYHPPMSGNSHSLLGHSAHAAKLANQEDALSGRYSSQAVHDLSAHPKASGPLDAVVAATAISFPQSPMNPLARLGGGLGAATGKDATEIQEIYDVAPRDIPNPKGVFNEVAHTSTFTRSHPGHKKMATSTTSPSDKLGIYLEKYMRVGEKWPMTCGNITTLGGAEGDAPSITPVIKAQMEAARLELDLIINNILSTLPPDSSDNSTTTSALQNETNGMLYGRSRAGGDDPRIFLCSALPPTPKAFLHPSIYLPRTTMKYPIAIHRKLSEYFPTLFGRDASCSAITDCASSLLPPTATGTVVRSSTLTPFPRADLREIQASDEEEGDGNNLTSYPVILQRPLHLMGPLSYHALTALPAYPTAAPSRLPPDHDLSPRTPASSSEGPTVSTQGSRFDAVTATYNRLESAWEKVNAHLAL